MTGAGLAKPASGGFTPSCTESATFLTAATGVTLTADKTNYDTLICTDLVAAGVWHFDVLYIWAAPSAVNAALINLANPGSFTAVPTNGTTTFTSYQGYTGDATAFYMATGFNPSTASSPNFVQDSANFGVYVLNARTTGALIWDIGSTSGLSGLLFSPYQTGGGGSIDASINSATSIGNGSPASSQGSWNVTRVSSIREDVFLNSSETSINGTADTSQAPLNQSVIFFALNTALFFTSDQIAAAWIGKGLSNVESCKVNNAINSYMARLAAPQNVYSNSAC